MSGINKLPKLGPLIFFIFLAWLLFWVVAWWYLDWSNCGSFGDSFGAVNSLFSGLALAFIIYSIIQQQAALSLQQKELFETREEFRIQNQTLKKQRFENTFFSLLNLHQTIVDRIVIQVGGSVFTGGESLKHLHQEFKDSYLDLQAKLGNPKLDPFTISDHRSKVWNVFNTFYRKHEGHLSQCFKNFVTMAQITKDSDLIPENEKELYYSIIKTQIHPCEVILLFYYCNVGDGLLDRPLFYDLKLHQTIARSLWAHEDHGFLFDPIETVESILREGAP